MGLYRLSRPGRADFRRGAVAQGKNKIEPRAPGVDKFIPAFAAQPVGFVAEPHQHLTRDRIDVLLRMAAGAEAAEFSLAPAVNRALRYDTAGRIAGAEKQDIKLAIDLRSQRLLSAAQGRRLVLATVLGEIANEVVHHVEVGRIDDRPAFAPRPEQTRVSELIQME